MYLFGKSCTHFRPGATIIVPHSECNESRNLSIYLMYVGRAQYKMQALKGKYLVDSNCIRS